MYRRRRRSLTLAAASTILLLLPAQAVASTHAQGKSAAPRYLGSLDDSRPQQVNATSETLKAKPAGEMCTPTDPGSPDRRAGVAETCTAITPAALKPSTAAKMPSATTAQADEEVCTVSKPGYWHFERLGSCLREMSVKFTLRGEHQEELGSAFLFVSSNAKLNPRSGTWTESIAVEFADPKGITSLNVAADVSCTSQCTATQKFPWTGAKTLIDNGVLAEGSVTYSNVPAIDKTDFSTMQYHLYITHTGSMPTKPNVDWENPNQVRCNSHLTDLGNTSTGCVDNTIPQPDLEMPISKYGAAAVTYGWAQWNLKDKWGLYSGSPMTRATNGKDRREFTCGSKSSDPFEYMPDTEVVNDSCDEFPFASTEQGGNDGALCAEIVPRLQGNGKYTISEAWDDRPVTGQEPCVRGHVNLGLNTTAGSAYSRYIQDWRLIDKDPFHFSVPDYFDMVE